MKRLVTSKLWWTSAGIPVKFDTHPSSTFQTPNKFLHAAMFAKFCTSFVPWVTFLYIKSLAGWISWQVVDAVPRERSTFSVSVTRWPSITSTLMSGYRHNSLQHSSEIRLYHSSNSSTRVQTAYVVHHSTEHSSRAFQMKWPFAKICTVHGET